MYSRLVVVAEKGRLPRIDAVGALAARVTGADTVHIVGAAATPLGGDEIEIDVENRVLRVNVDDAELARRRQEKGDAPWKPTKPRERRVSKALRAYASMVTSADKGAVRVVED